ncbi:MAG: polymer-forming cytoskeletal protein [Anaerolineae bacterium]|nr:polymer-forming cytoskeletal protein [Anaerolineae bacterium]
MFGRGKKEEQPSRQSAGKGVTIETIVGPNAHFRGDVQSDGGARIEGVFEGTIDITGNLIIGEGAKVIADISAHNISISGAIKGDINGNKVEILENGRVWGNLTVTSLLLNEGAYLRGKTTMQGDIEPPMIEAPKGSKREKETEEAKIVDVEPKVKKVKDEA